MRKLISLLIISVLVLFGTFKTSAQPPLRGYRTSSKLQDMMRLGRQRGPGMPSSLWHTAQNSTEENEIKLLNQLNSNSAVERGLALDKAFKVAEENYSDKLRRAIQGRLNDPSAENRQKAAILLQAMGQKGSLLSLKAAVKDERIPRVRQAMEMSLQDIERNVILERLESVDSRVRLGAVEDLKKMAYRHSPNWVVEKLIEKTSDAKPNVRKAAAQALGDLQLTGWEVIQELEKMADEERIDELRKTAQLAVDRIKAGWGKQLIQGEDVFLRRSGIDLIFEVQNRRPDLTSGIALLANLLYDKDELIRRYSAEKLGELKRIEALPFLRQALSNYAENEPAIPFCREAVSKIMRANQDKLPSIFRPVPPAPKPAPKPISKSAPKVPISKPVPKAPSKTPAVKIPPAPKPKSVPSVFVPRHKPVYGPLPLSASK